MHAFIFLITLPVVLGQLYMLNLDCAKTPGPCNNNCYGVYVMDKSVNLNYNGPDSQATSRRRAEAGCVRDSPCRNGKMQKPNDDENTCDEYPYASTIEGGSGSAIRCVAGDENSAEGTDLSRDLKKMCNYEPCTFTVTFGNPGGGLTPYCLDRGGANDGFQYIFNNGNYGLAKKDSNVTEEHGWALHEPDPSLYFAPHLRREFLLDNGERTVIGSRDLEADYSEAIFFTRRNGTLQKNRAVRELFGLEKTEELRHPSLRKAKRSLPFAA